MNNCKLFLGILSLIFSLMVPKSVYAYDPHRGNVTAVLGPYIFRTNYEGSQPGLNSPNLGGMSLTALGDVSDYGSLEVVGIYMNKIYFRSEGGKDVAEKTQQFHITMGYRYWFGSYFSTSLGIYTSYPMGESEIVHDNAPPGQRLNTSATEPSESGLDWGLQFEFWNNGRWATTLETRYSYSLTKLSNEYADQYGMSIGVRYFIQGDDKDAAMKSDHDEKTKP